MGAIQRLAEVVADAADPQPVHECLLANFVEVLGADQAAPALFDVEGDLRVATHRLLDTSRAAAEGNCPWPSDATGAEPIVVADVLSAPARSLQNVVAGQHTRALVIVP